MEITQDEIDRLDKEILLTNKQMSINNWAYAEALRYQFGEGMRAVLKKGNKPSVMNKLSDISHRFFRIFG